MPLPNTNGAKLGHGQVTGGFLGLVLHVNPATLHHVFQRGHVREQVEALEHHAEARTLCLAISLSSRVCSMSWLFLVTCL